MYAIAFGLSVQPSQGKQLCRHFISQLTTFSIVIEYTSAKVVIFKACYTYTLLARCRSECLCSPILRNDKFRQKIMARYGEAENWLIVHY